MLLNSSYLEMNQAVPGTLGSPLMEPMLDCRVPSPSQWSDPCNSPLSFHSPTHRLSYDLDKLKEEPPSPPSYSVLYSPPAAYSYSNPLMSKESGGGESSYDLADFLPEQPTPIQQSPQQTVPASSQTYNFLDVYVKTEPTTTTIQTQSVSTAPIPSESVSAELILLRAALGHYREHFVNISDLLNIPRDAAHWTVENVKTWLRYEATKLDEKPLLMLDHWQLNGAQLLQLTDEQFYGLVPPSCKMLWSTLEIWKELSLSAQTQEGKSLPIHQRTHSYTFSTGNPTTTVKSESSFETSVVSSQVSAPLIPTVVPASSYSPVVTSQETSPMVHTSLASSVQVGMVSATSTVSSSPLQIPTSVLGDMPAPSSSPVNPTTTASELGHCSYLQDLPSIVPETIPQTVVSESSRERRDTESLDEEATPGNSGRGSTHIHLWQFLKELLQKPQDYGSCIRWLDRAKGIFKIEDSVRVAKLWGRRKNRPAMNYDKLSRSIRQYYKKGIMKKTERSQRLVYQFCHPYSL